MRVKPNTPKKRSCLNHYLNIENYINITLVSTPYHQSEYLLSAQTLMGEQQRNKYASKLVGNQNEFHRLGKSVKKS